MLFESSSRAHPYAFRLDFRKLLMVALAVAMATAVAQAHSPSDVFLSLKFTSTNVTGQWQISARDLQHAVGLDTSDARAIGPQELRLREEAVALDTLPRFKLIVDDIPAAIVILDQETLQRPDGDAFLYRFQAGPWSARPSRLRLDGAAFLDLDPSIRCILRVEYWGPPFETILNAARPAVNLQLSNPASQMRQLLTFVHEGIWHIWTGYDHILFLIALLLPAVLRWHDRQWDSAAAFRPVIMNVLKIVTAFTLAHSLTLALASLRIVTLPTRWVESVIAASVVVAATNNLIPLFRERSWMVAFGFGLVHGFGFANVLTEAGLPKTGLVLALVGFNVGVEIGQLAIVALFVPIAYQFRQTVGYRNVALRAGSVAVMILAGIWMAERMFDFKVLPF